jgi:hypothetical protein
MRGTASQYSGRTFARMLSVSPALPSTAMMAFSFIASFSILDFYGVSHRVFTDDNRGGHADLSFFTSAKFWKKLLIIARAED